MPPSQMPLTGNALDRFVIVSTLLYLIDPVRGEPTIHNLDKHPEDGAWKRENLQRKFLDSFALICSTSKKGGETASAVCLEQDESSGAVLRLARNHGVPSSLVGSLQGMLDDLATASSRGGASASAISKLEDDILLRVIDLDRDKIVDLFEKFRRAETQADLQRISLASGPNGNFHSARDGRSTAAAAAFNGWVSKLAELETVATEAPSSTLIPYIKWASQARWTHSKELELLLSSKLGGVPRWINSVYKLGRYYAAAKAMVKTAVKDPGMFDEIRVAALDAPKQQEFAVRSRATLNAELKRASKMDPDQLVSELAPAGTSAKDQGPRFLRAFRHVLTVHAEMQLLSFYDHDAGRTPRLLFMGTSKKACFLCHEFMMRHRLKMSVSACHQKIYPSWMPAPSSDPAIRKAQENLLFKLQARLEKIAALDVGARLGLRRPMNWDSTAGPSLTTTGSIYSTRNGEAVEGESVLNADMSRLGTRRS